MLCFQGVDFLYVHHFIIFEKNEMNMGNNEAFKPQQLEYRTYTMCKKIFQLYSLEGFDFKSKLDIGNGKGLYCFTKKGMNSNSGYAYGMSWKSWTHTLLYLGKSNDFTKRPYEHDKLSELKDAEYLGVYYCNESEDPKDIESLILDNYFFLKNNQENQEQGNRKTIVTEDPVSL